MHEKKYTREQLLEFIAEAIKGVFPESHHSMMDSRDSEGDLCLRSFLYKFKKSNEIIDWLIENKEFQLVNYQENIRINRDINLLDLKSETQKYSENDFIFDTEEIIKSLNKIGFSELI